MSVAILTAILALIVGGLGLLAQTARKSRGAEIALAITLVALSLLTAGLGVLAILGALMVASAGNLAPDRLVFAASGAAAILAGIVGAALCIPQLHKIWGSGPRHEFWTDPPVVLALWISVMLLANNAVSLLIFAREQNLETLFPGERIGPISVLSAQLPFALVAAMGVGIGVRRNLRQTLDRLGYRSISPRQLGVVVLFIGAALALSVAADALFAALQPDLYRRVGELSERLFDPQGLGPVQVVFFAALIGVGAGLGEETLFRGALQPALGIPFTSVLFASLHIQYGPSLLLGYVFLLSVGLGLLRRYINTTASFLAHTGYNALGVLLSYFFGF